MEGFALIDTGIWSIVPPLLALGLALLTKEVYSSLTIGVFVGMVIYTFTIDGVGFGSLVDAFCLVPQMMGEQLPTMARCCCSWRCWVRLSCLLLLPAAPVRTVHGFRST